MPRDMKTIPEAIALRRSFVDVREIQQQRVSDDGDIRQRHRGSGDQGIEESERGERNRDHVIDESEEQILADRAHGRARKPDGRGDAMQAAADEDDVAGFFGDVGA